ncbi:neutral amino acid permease [Fusarium tjaetaba]|uniref:Neutral amino acid permease n=1 Tax=Fusarium tjaetaba TaxID=1567544 RepID=A0A8H5QZ15_9HYPO|nr:neutral amino acid permease [Fusarium tjaetaba]KAF5623167.1 neutral amino acid permease [Fusarium tjaetaba]
MGIIHANNRESGALDPVPILSQDGPNQDDARPTVAHDEVFGDITEDGPNYRDVGWLGTSALMMKTQIGLGILSIPSAFHTLGLVPGLICLLVIGGITTWSDYIIGTFKLNHREVYGIDDAGGILFGRFGREVLGISFSLLAAIIVFLCASIRTLGRISWLAWVGVISLLAGVYVVTIAVSIQDRPSAAPKINLQHEWKSDYQLYGKPSFTEAMSALSTMVFAYAGTPLFFPIAAEMRDPRHYTKAMLLCQSVATATYIIVGVIIYYYCGSYVASPALGSAGKTIKQVAYGLALPGLIVGATINAHEYCQSDRSYKQIESDYRSRDIIFEGIQFNEVMSLTWRISVNGETDSPEDYLSTALGVIFPDDITNQHGDDEHNLSYASPHLPKSLVIDLADPVKEDHRKLFSHYLWNSSLLLAEFIEADSLSIPLENPREAQDTISFNVKGLETLELGAGTALPSIMGGLLGAKRVVATDYPAEPVLKTLRTNVARNIQPSLSPAGAEATPSSAVSVQGHSWGELDDTFSTSAAHSFDRVIAADCLWMPWQHQNLHRSIAHFLKQIPEARCWVVAGFHTGRTKMSGFFDAAALQKFGLEVERIWERDCNGEERPWDTEREDDVTVRKRWLVVASLKWISTS